MSDKLLEDRFAKILVQYSLKQPYFGLLLSHFSRKFEDNLTCSIGYTFTNSGQPILHINVRRFFMHYHGEEAQMSCFTHQMLHFILAHHAKIHQFPNVKRARFDLAADLHTNRFKGFSPSEKNSILMSAIPQLGTTDEQSFGDIVTGLNDKNLEFLLTNLGNSYFSEDARQHDLWAQEQWSAAKSAIVSQNTKSILSQIHQDQPSIFFEQLPASLQRHIQSLIQDSSADDLHWTSILNRFIGNSNQLTVKNSLRKNSKRYGTFPGLKIKKKVKLLVALDTSASIQQEQLESFWLYLQDLPKSTTEIQILEVDAEIQKKYLFRHQDSPSAFKGGGGTNFTPAIEFANTSKPNVLIYFTDGKASTPSVAPKIPTIWLLTNKDTAEHLQGKVIHLG